MPREVQTDSRVVVITGASAGLGRAIATRFSQGGDKVGLIARDEAALDEFKRELERGGGIAAYAVADVGDAEQVFAAAEKLESELGPIDIWVNDAMLTVFSMFGDIKPDEYRRVTEVTYLGQVHGMMAALKHMKPRNKGQVINVGSALGYRGVPLQSAYCGAKHAVRGFTDAVRSELIYEKSGIVLSICDMPAMNTPQFDWARAHVDRKPRPAGGSIYQPEACAEAVFRASRNKTREYWVGRSTFMTIVGNILAPAYLDRYLARTAVSGQMRKEKVSPDRKDNLYRPVTALHRSHGDFDSQAKNHAMILPGQAARAGVVLTGALVCLVIGGVAGALIS